MCTWNYSIPFFLLLTKSRFLAFYEYANGLWRDLFVTVFFIVSGVSLYYRYADDWGNGSLGTYFYKRWRSIFPMYYLIYLYFEVSHIITFRSLFLEGIPQDIFSLY